MFVKKLLLVSAFSSLLTLVGAANANPLDVDAIIHLANQAATSGRCMDRGISPAQCEQRLRYALTNNLITQRAYDWAQANGYYPVIDIFDNTIGALCKCGCFDPATVLSARINGVELDVAAGQIGLQHQLLALQDDATLNALHKDYRPLTTVVKGPEATALYEFSLSNGRTLAVTQHHGMVLSDGRVIAAKDVSSTDQFLSADGDTVAITAIGRRQADADVVNFETQGDSELNHIIVAEGVFVGDLVWQNQLAADLGKVALRQ